MVILPPPRNDPDSPGARRAIIYLLLTLAVFFIAVLTVSGLAQTACDPDLDCDTAVIAGLSGAFW